MWIVYVLAVVSVIYAINTGIFSSGAIASALMACFYYWVFSKAKKNKENNKSDDSTHNEVPITNLGPDKTKVSPSNVINKQNSKPATIIGSEFDKLMTSQLVAIWLYKQDDKYKEEYLRRLKCCGLSEETAETMLNFEKEILQTNPRPELLKESYITSSLFPLNRPFLEHDIAYYQTNFVYTLSEIVKISDEAEWHYWYSHERDLDDKVWEEIFNLSDRNKKLFLPFANNLLSLGWTVENVNKFSYNEQGMLDKYRWNNNYSKAARQPWKD